jgi:hypothetical protein
MKDEKKLSRSAKSVLLYGIYIVVLGMVFLFIPGVALSLLGMKPAHEVWIHVAGWFGIWLGIYYIVAARSESKAFIRTTVYGRPTFIVFLGVLAILKKIEPIIMIVGAIDVATAIWTYSLLRLEKRHASSRELDS